MIEKRISSLEGMIKRSVTSKDMERELKSLKRMIADNNFSESFEKKLKGLEQIVKKQNKMIDAMRSRPVKEGRPVPIVIDIKRGPQIVPYPV